MQFGARKRSARDRLAGRGMVSRQIKDALATGNVEALAALAVELADERETTEDPQDQLAITRVLLMAIDAHERAIYRRKRAAQTNEPSKKDQSAVDELLARRAKRHGRSA